MSNFPKPNELEELLDLYVEKLEVYAAKFNPYYQKASKNLKEKAHELKTQIEKYANFYKDLELQHLVLSDHALKAIQSINLEISDLEAKIGKLDKMFRLGQNLL